MWRAACGMHLPLHAAWRGPSAVRVTTLRFSLFQRTRAPTLSNLFMQGSTLRVPHAPLSHPSRHRHHPAHTSHLSNSFQPLLPHSLALYACPDPQALNAYVEKLGRGMAPGSLHLEFWVRDETASRNLSKVVTDLPSSGALEPLFYCFGLISDDELQAGLASKGATAAAVDTNFLAWLRQTVYEAVLLAERHEDMKQRIREARASIEYKHSLASLQVCAYFGVEVEVGG